MIEETQSAKRSLLIVLVATVAVALVIGIYVYAGQKPPVAVGTILKLDTAPIHSEMRIGEGAQGVQGGMDVYDQQIVLAEVQVKNQTSIPLFLHDISANVAMADGTEQRSLAANRTDFQNVFLAYKQLASLQSAPLLRDITIQPGQTVEGLTVFHYPITKEQWESRHGFSVVVSFLHQKDLEIPWPAEK